MKLLNYVLLFFVLAMNCHSQNKIENVESKEISAVPNEFNVSIISLIANPEKFNGKTVQVVGYLNLEYEGDAIYLHKEDWKKGLRGNGLRVDFTSEIALNPMNHLKQCNKKYVIIIGTFIMDKLDDPYSGKITHITKLEDWGKK
jgi:hypothetical protein